MGGKISDHTEVNVGAALLQCRRSQWWVLSMSGPQSDLHVYSTLWLGLKVKFPRNRSGNRETREEAIALW